MEVLVFKTNVSGEEEISEVRDLLSSLPAIESWNFDLDDCDRILRIVATDLYADEVEDLLEGAGIRCVEL